MNEVAHVRKRKYEIDDKDVMMCIYGSRINTKQSLTSLYDVRTLSNKSPSVVLFI